MDGLTHGLCGLGIFAVWATAATVDTHSALAVGGFVTAVLGSEAPDADYVVKRFSSSTAYLHQHRGKSHSIPFWVGWAAIVAGLVSLWVPGHFWTYFGLAFVSVVLHVSLDVLTTYRTEALWPIVSRRFAYDVLGVVDVFLWICGIVGIILANTGWPLGNTVEFCGGAAVLYIGYRCILSITLRQQVRTHYPLSYETTIVPGFLPWWWSYVAQSGVEMVAGRIHLGGEIDPQVCWKRPAEVPTAVAFALQAGKVGPAFRAFSRHLFWKTEEDGEVTRVTLIDALHRSNRTFPFTAYVVVQKLDRGGFALVDESLRGQPMDANSLLLDAISTDDSLQMEINTFPPSRSFPTNKSKT